ncbi:Miraculin protein [Spatholobus suberectus]|nr:Miraculin protein [Spatholobus suberectus]
MKITLLPLVFVVTLSTKPLLGAAGPALSKWWTHQGRTSELTAITTLLPASLDVGGLALASTDVDCPLDVVLVDGYQGLPVTFTVN